METFLQPHFCPLRPRRTLWRTPATSECLIRLCRPAAETWPLFRHLWPPWGASLTQDTSAEKSEGFERRNKSIREKNGNFDSCNSCKRLVPSRLHELHESKFPFVSRSEFIRSKLSNFSAHVSGSASLPAGTRLRLLTGTDTSQAAAAATGHPLCALTAGRRCVALVGSDGYRRWGRLGGSPEGCSGDR